MNAVTIVDVPIEVWGWYGDDRLAVLFRCTCKKLSGIVRPTRQFNRVGGITFIARDRYCMIWYDTPDAVKILNHVREVAVRCPLRELSYMTSAVAMSAELGFEGVHRCVVALWSRPRIEVVYAYAACTGGRSIPDLRDLVYLAIGLWTVFSKKL